MKNNKEFIDDIYKKYEEQKRESSKKKHNITKTLKIVAVFFIIFSLSIYSEKIINPNSVIEIEKNNNQEDSKKALSLATIDNFDNLYNIVKNNIKQSEDTYKEIQTETSADTVMNKAENLETNTRSENYSKTNTQEENVDEADIVKVDGNYIYYVIENKIIIVDIKEELKQVAQIDYSEEEFNPSEIYVNKDKLIVLGNEHIYSRNNIKTAYETADVAYVTSDSKQKSVVIIYDLSDISNPKEIRKVEVDGYYMSSRMIGNNIYFVSNKYMYLQNMCKRDIQELNENDYKPKYTDSAISNEEKCIEFNNIYYFDNIENTSYLMIAGLDILSSKEVCIETLLGAGEIIYSSEKNMYIAKAKTQYDINTGEFLGGITKIIKYELNNGIVQFKAETDIDGVVNNQFSMDEENEYFRIATTVGRTWNMDENTSNNLYVLDRDLKEVGKLQGLAKEEKIYSVRYVGNKAYMVTFKEVDPLFVIDLSNPSKPEVLGELEIPGYSTYLHPYDETHLIGFGYDTKEDGTRITTNGLKMAMFDISDLNNPKELFKVNIGDKSTSSELIYNHKALLFSKEKNLIAFPVIKYSSSGNNSRAQIYDIDLEKGFTLRGELSTGNTKDYKKNIERVIYSDNIFYTLSQRLIAGFDMYTLKEIKRLEI